MPGNFALKIVNITVHTFPQTILAILNKTQAASGQYIDRFSGPWGEGGGLVLDILLLVTQNTWYRLFQSNCMPALTSGKDKCTFYHKFYYPPKKKDTLESSFTIEVLMFNKWCQKSVAI